jgi:glycosyltransferase involved in cell wall biosynthesis
MEFLRKDNIVINGKKVVVVMPAYNARKTLEKTYRDIPKELVDEVILVDDASRDETAQRAKELGIKTILHLENKGYGGNQKTCYREALKSKADIIIMLHPDYQYEPKLVPAMASMIASEIYDVVLGSRILTGRTLKGGMPLYKYIANRFLTLVQNILMGQKLSEYHTGYRAFSKKVLEELPLEKNSDDFVFDNEFLTEAAFFGFNIGEISCPTKYFTEASSINLKRSMKYGFGVLWSSIKYRLQRMNVAKFKIFDNTSGRLDVNANPRHAQSL